MNIPRILLTAVSSGSGKTLITCGLLQALKDRGHEVVSFKCGPDYIDPLFHEQVIGTKSRNLDSFFTPDALNEVLAHGSAGCDIAILEGVMGYYDGLGGVSSEASAFDVAEKTKTPTLLIVNCKGVSVSILPIIKGFLQFKEQSHIAGILLNQLQPMRYQSVKEMIEKECGVSVYGYIPNVADCALESRHLGLVMPNEIADIKAKIKRLGDILQETIDMDRVFALAKTAEPFEIEQPNEGEEKETLVKIGLARDEAFCFIYEENLQVLRELGAQLVEFSPLHDKHLPKGINGLLLYGGYPELYAKELSENQTMLAEIREAIDQKMPCIAECGGFLYLHEQLEGMDEKSYSLVGAITGSASNAKKLRNFGYITLSGANIFGAETGSIRAHEFHYFQSTNNGDDMHAEKPIGKRTWKCMHSSDYLLAGFPHLYYRANTKVVEAFLEKAYNRANIQGV